MPNVEEVKIIAKNIPLPLLRLGRLLILLLAVVFLVLLWLLEYKVVIKGELRLTSPSEPIPLVCKTSAYVDAVIPPGDTVRQGQLIATLRSNASPEDLQVLQQLLVDRSPDVTALPTLLNTLDSLQLGALQPLILDLQQQVATYQSFLTKYQKQNRIGSKQALIEVYRKRYAVLQEKGAALTENIEIATDQLAASTTLAEESLVADVERQQAQQELLDKQALLLDNDNALRLVEIEIDVLRQEMTDTQTQYEQDRQALEEQMGQQLAKIKYALSQWKHDFAIYAPTAGIITFGHNFVSGQYVQEDKVFATVIPQYTEQAYCQLLVPLKGAAQIEKGQTVNVLLSNYPPADYGILKGQVATVDALPQGRQLQVNVLLPEALKTTYGFSIPFQPNVSGTGEILIHQRNFYEIAWAAIRGQFLNR